MVTMIRWGGGLKILRTSFLNGPIGRWEGAWKFLLNNLVACSLFLGTLYRHCRSIGRQFFKTRDSFHFFRRLESGGTFPSIIFIFRVHDRCHGSSCVCQHWCTLYNLCLSMTDFDRLCNFKIRNFILLVRLFNFRRST